MPSYIEYSFYYPKSHHLKEAWLQKEMNNIIGTQNFHYNDFQFYEPCSISNKKLFPWYFNLKQ